MMSDLQEELTSLKKIARTEEKIEKAEAEGNEERWKILMEDLKEDKEYLKELQREKNILLERGTVPTAAHAPFPAVPPAGQPAYPYLRRFYVLFNLQRPAAMLERGVREHIVAQMKGRPIGGTVHRENLPLYGESVIIRASGTPETLETLESTVLEIKDEEGREYWEWEYDTPHYRDSYLTKLTSHSFSIADSRYGATRGPNSDPKYDNKSEKSSKTGKSSKSGQSGKL